MPHILAGADAPLPPHLTKGNRWTLLSGYLNGIFAFAMVVLLAIGVCSHLREMDPRTGLKVTLLASAIGAIFVGVGVVAIDQARLQVIRGWRPDARTLS